MDIVEGENLQKLASLYDRVKSDPFENGLWEDLVRAAKKEEQSKRQTTIYDRVPLAEITSVAKRLNENGDKENKLQATYAILSSASPIEGLTWYDLILAPPHEDILKALETKIGENSWETALDLGSGTGRSTEILVGHSKNVIAIDIVPENAEFLRDKFKKVKVIKGDVTELNKLGIATQSINLLLCNGVIPYIQDQNKILGMVEEIDKIIAPGGSVFIAGPRKSFVEKYFSYEKERMKSAKGLLFALLNEKISPVNKNSRETNMMNTAQFGKSFHDKGYKEIYYRDLKSEAVVVEFKKPQ